LHAVDAAIELRAHGDHLAGELDLSEALELVLDAVEGLAQLGAHTLLGHEQPDDLEHDADRPRIDARGGGRHADNAREAAEELHHALGHAPRDPLLLGLVICRE
jgi:hypothetical protein